jgi:hypothetical protein
MRLFKFHELLSRWSYVLACTGQFKNTPLLLLDENRAR